MSAIDGRKRQSGYARPEKACAAAEGCTMLIQATKRSGLCRWHELVLRRTTTTTTGGTKR